MELWIRSQDKTQLLEAKKFSIIGCTNNSYSGVEFNVLSEQVYLGHYSTKERCLEILDEIQKILSDIILLVNDTGKQAIDNLYDNGIALMGGNEKIEQLGTYVYQMPEK